MNTKNSCYFDLGYLLAASKNIDYKNRTLEVAKVLANFLETKCLTKRKLLPDDESIGDSLEIWSSDLTDEGIKLMQNGVKNWYRGHDRGKPISDVSSLEKALLKIREA